MNVVPWRAPGLKRDSFTALRSGLFFTHALRKASKSLEFSGMPGATESDMPYVPML